MNTLFIIIALIIGLLLIVGTTQRAKIKLWFKSEVTDFVDNNIDGVKVIKLQIKEMKTKIKLIVDQAGELFALENLQLKQLKGLIEESSKLLKEAKQAKKDDNPEKAKEKLRLKIEIDKQIELIQQNIDTLNKQRLSLELKVQKGKTFITTNEIKVKGLAARKSVNDLLKNTINNTITGDTIEETLTSAEESINKDELKLEYMADPTEETPVQDSKIDKAFDEL